MQAPLATAIHTADVYTDFSGFNDLRRIGRDDPDAALREVARQFEGIFLNMVLKSMRDASFGNPLFSETDDSLYSDLFDRQLSLSLSSGRGMGLAETLVQQLRGVAGLAREETTASPALAQDRLRERRTVAAQRGNVTALRPQRDPEPHFRGPEDFIRTLRPHAEAAARRIGVAPEVLLAQAALETGWGQAMSTHADGRSSFNVFNIKAGNDWHGASVTVRTLEYRDGAMRPERAQFRAYDSFAESFDDYVDLIWNSPRYQQALVVADEGEAYMAALSEAGYATDPDYTAKVMDILQRENLGLSAELSEVAAHG